jgi:hypothetical protein
VIQIIEQYNALIAFFLHIPFPEDLPEEKWFEKAAQIRWLEKTKILGWEFKRNGNKGT